MADPLAPLMPRIAAGDRDAFAELYRALERPVFRFVRSRLNDPFGSADILHDTFLEVWKSAGRFEGRSKVQTWIMGIAHRKTIDAFRRSARTDLTDTPPDLPDGDADPVAALAAVEEGRHLRHCLDGLKDAQRTVVSLAFYEDMSYAEIAHALSVPEGTVKTRIHHAKKLLLHCLEARLRGGMRR